MSTSLMQFLGSQALSIAVPPGFPDFQISNPKLLAPTPAKPAEIEVQCDLDLSTLSIAGFPIDAFESLLPSPGTLPTTITMDSGGADDTARYYKISFQPASFNIPVPGGTGLAVGKPTFSITAWPNKKTPVAVFSASGSFTLSWTDNPNVQFLPALDVSMSSGVAEAQVALNIKFPASQGLQLPGDLSRFVDINHVGASMGVGFDPPGFQLGVSVDGTIGAKNLIINDCTIVVNLEGEVPVVDYVAMSVKGNMNPEMGHVSNGMSIPNILDNFWPSLSLDSSAPNVLNGDLSIKDPEFIWCENSVLLPNGKVVKPGFSCSGFVSLFEEFDFYGSLDIVYDTSVGGFFVCSPISLFNGLLSFKGAGSELAIKKHVHNTHTPQSHSQWARRQTLAETIVVKAGGPVLDFALTEENFPYLNLNATGHFFGCELAVNARVSKSGISFEITEVEEIATGSASFTLAENEGNLAVNGAMAFAPISEIVLPHNLGTISTGKNSIHAALSVNDNGVSCALSLTVLGDTLNLFNMNNVTATTIADLIQEASKYIENHIEEIVQAIGENPLMWFKLMDNGVIKAVDMATTAAIEVLDKLAIPGWAVPQYVKNLAYTFSQITYCGNQPWADAMQTVYPDTLEAAGVVVHAAGYGVNEVANALSTCGIDPKYAAEAFNTLKVPIADAANAILSNFKNLNATDVGNLLKGAGYAGSEVISVFKSLGGDFASAASTVAHDFDPSNW